MVRGMREITCKATVRTCVALLARANHVFPAQVRAGIRNRHDVVRAMTVIALCSLRVSKLGDLSVVGVEIGLCDFHVTLPALRHDLELEAFGVGAPDGVGRMTGIAHRERLLRFSHLRRVYAQQKLLLDSVVTMATRRRDVPGIHARRRIRHREDRMGGMAIRACCRDGQATFQQSLPMDTFGIPFYNLVLRAGVSHSGFVPFPVASRAKIGNVRGENRRPGFLPSMNPVRTMALGARWSVGIVFRDELSVDAFLVLLAHLGMARSTIDLPGDRLARAKMRSVHAGMALAAGDPGVARSLYLIELHRQHPPIPGGAEVRA